MRSIDCPVDCLSFLLKLGKALIEEVGKRESARPDFDDSMLLVTFSLTDPI